MSPAISSFARRAPWSTVLCLLGIAAIVASVPQAVSQPAPLTHHMIVHILLMNVVAPVFALTFKPLPTSSLAGGRALVAASALQLALLWMLHIPLILEASMRSPTLQAGLFSALLASASIFWASVLTQRGAGRWRALVALLLTGKVFCLLAALLVFAPRHLYPGLEHGGGHAGAASLSDQQLAGLLMLAACPLAYVAAAVAIAALWLRELGIGEAAATAQRP
jgi:putative membrane protein